MDRSPNIVLTGEESEPLLVSEIGDEDSPDRSSEFWLVGRVVTQHGFNVRVLKNHYGSGVEGEAWC